MQFLRQLDIESSIAALANGAAGLEEFPQKQAPEHAPGTHGRGFTSHGESINKESHQIRSNPVHVCTALCCADA